METYISQCKISIDLGLSICKKIAHALNGDVWVESVEGEGSTFFFSCWLEKADVASPLAARKSNTLKGKRIILVDDNPRQLKIMGQYISNAGPVSILLAEDNLVNQKLILIMLGKEEWQVELAGNGQAAVDKVCEKQFVLEAIHKYALQKRVG